MNTTIFGFNLKQHGPETIQSFVIGYPPGSIVFRSFALFVTCRYSETGLFVIS
ncbi:hypothetical protein I4U23_020332 [Adineta vaga]|nr:hypothetical protein I4U23_020332 [Adineta vaga]